MRKAQSLYYYRGKRLSVPELSKLTGVSKTSLYRCLKSGVPVEDVVRRMGKSKCSCPTCEHLNEPSGCDECVNGSLYRKAFEFLTEKELKEERRKCKTCKFVWKVGNEIRGCNYVDIMGCCRGCDPRDCKTLGYYKPGRRIKRRLTASGNAEIIEGRL